MCELLTSVPLTGSPRKLETVDDERTKHFMMLGPRLRYLERRSDGNQDKRPQSSGQGRRRTLRKSSASSPHDAGGPSSPGTRARWTRSCRWHRLWPQTRHKRGMRHSACQAGRQVDGTISMHLHGPKSGSVRQPLSSTRPHEHAFIYLVIARRCHMADTAAVA